MQGDRIIITMYGGLVHNVATNIPGLEVLIKDYDEREDAANHDEAGETYCGYLEEPMYEPTLVGRQFLLWRAEQGKVV